MTAVAVPEVRAGIGEPDYSRPPISGPSLFPADVLTNPARWQALGFGYDNTQPAPVPVPGGIAFTWTTDEGKGALQGVVFPGVAGQSYTLSLSMWAAAGAAPWRAAVGWRVSGPWVEPDGFDHTQTMTWTAPETRDYWWGVETAPNDSMHTVVGLGVWSHNDPGITWNPTPLDPCRIVLPFRVTVGRSVLSNQPDPPTCDFTWRGETAPFTQGTPVEVDLPITHPGPAVYDDPTVVYDAPNYLYDGQTTALRPRFRGTVHAVKAIEIGGVVRRWEVSCVGRSAALGRFKYKANRPAETDVARVKAICAAAGWTVNIAGKATVKLVADSVDRDALSALWQVCESSAGLLWENPDGTLWYGCRDHRWPTPLTGALPDCSIIDGLEWATDLGEVRNHITVTYGPQDTRTQNTYRDDDSITEWGYAHADADTLLADTVDANALAATILLRRNRPWWTAPGVLVYSDKITDADLRLVNTVRPGDAVAMPIPPTPDRVPASPHMWTVEGWVETWDTPTRQRIQFALTGRSRWGASALRTWATKRDGGTWAHWAAGDWLAQLNQLGGTRR